MNFKERPVPQEILDIWDDYAAADAARNAAVKGYFKFQLRNALYFSKIAEQKRREFWGKISDLWPELINKKLNFDPRKRVLLILEEKTS